MGPDERTLFLLDRDALIGLVATFGTRYAGIDVAMLVDPNADTIRIAYDGFTDEQDTTATNAAN